MTAPEQVEYTTRPKTLTYGSSIALLTGVMLSTLTVVQLLERPETHDFGRSFIPSAKAWIATGRPYEFRGLVNLNPPPVTLLFVPLALLPLRVAATLWSAIGAGCLALTWMVASNRIPLSRSGSIGSLGVLLCTVAAAGLVWLEGQPTWLLVLVVTMGWLNYRDERPVQAGLYLGVAVAAKPFLAIAALPLGLLTLTVAAASSLAITITTVASTGWPMWQQWLSGTSTVDWIAHPGNASLWGLAARWSTPSVAAPITVSGLGPAVAMAIGVVAAGALILTYRRRDLDERWTLAMLTSILVSPLGWTHYLPLIAAPLTALWSTGRWTPTLSLAVGMLCVPPSIGYSPQVGASWIAGLTVGSLYSIAAVLIWVEIGRRAFRGTAQGGGRR